VHAIAPAGELEDVYEELPDRYGIEPDGAVLVRPDGHVAWRSRSTAEGAPDEPAAALGRVLARTAATELAIELEGVGWSRQR
jgi:hypothetical protein